MSLDSQLRVGHNIRLGVEGSHPPVPAVGAVAGPGKAGAAVVGVAGEAAAGGAAA